MSAAECREKLAAAAGCSADVMEFIQSVEAECLAYRAWQGAKGKTATKKAHAAWRETVSASEAIAAKILD